MKSCAVLDLDSTLVNMFGTDKEWNYMLGETRQDVLANTLDVKVHGNFMWGAKRPHCNAFLKACYETFDMVGVWSAGSVDYVDQIVEELFAPLGLRPAFVWAKPMCVDTAVESDRGSIPEGTELLKVKQKPLSKLFHAFPQIDPKRTLIFDDMKDVCEQDVLYHVHVPGFDGTFDTLHSGSICGLW